MIYNLHYTLYFAGLNKIVKVPKSSVNKVLLTTSRRQGQKFAGLNKIVKVPKSSVDKVLLTTFRRQGQKLSGF